MRLVLLSLLTLSACAGMPTTHHRTNADPTLRNGVRECPKNHWFNGARCVLVQPEKSPYR